MIFARLSKIASVVLYFACASHPYAQQTNVDSGGKSTGGLANALVFGSTEPQLEVCAGATFGSVHGCTVSVPTQEGITSARSGPPIAGQPKAYPNQYGLDFYTSGIARVSITHDGLIGIGTQSPTGLIDLRHSGNVDIGLTSADDAGRRWMLRSGGQGLSGEFQIIDGTTSIARVTIDATGLVSVKALYLTGGADIAEPFKIESALPAGSIVSIDVQHPGALKLSNRPYDRRVAGVISGAGGVTPGLTLAQLNSENNSQQVALSGRVYVLANVSGGSIEAGDLLTTSATPGEAMKAKNLRLAQGAVIGKAMTALRSGSGQVLVLVRPQ